MEQAYPWLSSQREVCRRGTIIIDHPYGICLFLAGKRAELVDRLTAVQASIDYIDWKQGFYDDVLSGRTPYISNLLPNESDAESAEESSAHE